MTLPSSRLLTITSSPWATLHLTNLETHSRRTLTSSSALSVWDRSCRRPRKRASICCVTVLKRRYSLFARYVGRRCSYQYCFGRPANFWYPPHTTLVLRRRSRPPEAIAVQRPLNLQLSSRAREADPSNSPLSCPLEHDSRPKTLADLFPNCYHWPTFSSQP
jgi:hypothetical protein